MRNTVPAWGLDSLWRNGRSERAPWDDLPTYRLQTLGVRHVRGNELKRGIIGGDDGGVVRGVTPRKKHGGNVGEHNSVSLTKVIQDLVIDWSMARLREPTSRHDEVCRHMPHNPNRAQVKHDMRNRRYAGEHAGLYMDVHETDVPLRDAFPICWGDYCCRDALNQV